MNLHHKHSCHPERVFRAKDLTLSIHHDPSVNSVLFLCALCVKSFFFSSNQPCRN
jgi:hypothetical protein